MFCPPSGAKKRYQLSQTIFISSCCKPLKTDPSGEISTCATWAKPFLTNTHPHNSFMPATAQLESFYYYKQSLI